MGKLFYVTWSGNNRFIISVKRPLLVRNDVIRNGLILQVTPSVKEIYPSPNKLYRKFRSNVSEMGEQTPMVFVSPPVSLEILGIENPQSVELSQFLCYQYDTPLDLDPPYHGIIAENGWEYSPDSKVFTKGDLIYPIADLTYNKKNTKLLV